MSRICRSERKVCVRMISTLFSPTLVPRALGWPLMAMLASMLLFVPQPLSGIDTLFPHAPLATAVGALVVVNTMPLLFGLMLPPQFRRTK